MKYRIETQEPTELTSWSVAVDSDGHWAGVARSPDTRDRLLALVDQANRADGEAENNVGLLRKQIAELKAQVERLSAEPDEWEVALAQNNWERDDVSMKDVLSQFIRSRLAAKPQPTPEQRVKMIESRPGYWSITKDGFLVTPLLYRNIAEIVRDGLIAQLKEDRNGK